MNKNVLITGGSRGIGLGIAKELAKSGYNLAINGMRKPQQIQGVIEDLANMGVEVIYCQGDVSSSAGREQILDATLSKFGRLHVLVNNAAVAPLKRNDLLETTEESYSRVLDTNLKGPFFLSQIVALHMIENKQQDPSYNGCIINISSVSATMASVNRGEYCLSKAGLSMLTKLFATRLGKHNIPVYEVRPGIIKTDMTADVLDKYEKMVDEGLNIQERLGSVEDVGKSVCALVEGWFPYSSGQVVMVDGGLTIPRL
ncbi:MAG: 3-ketoacyl-ACP reductase [Cyclobacteriaceae bacterium]|nr:3-ketoacyl-ACP reductase [Cyclobacteriaceae bacterium]